MPKMTVTVDGVKYDHDSEKVLNSELILVGDQTGMSPAVWQRKLNEDDGLAMKALVFMLKKRAGEDVDWNTLDFAQGGMEFDLDEPRPTKAGEASE